MKNTILTAVLLLSTTMSFAQEPRLTELTKVTVKTEVPKNKGTLYFRGVTESQPLNRTDVIPGLGIGYRKSFGRNGVDVSLNYSQGNKLSDVRKQITWTAPKVSYLHYLSSDSPGSLYGGLGLGWGGFAAKDSKIANNRNSNFVGLIPHVSIGYEALRDSIVTTFTELTISYPTVSSRYSGVHPGLVAEVSLGAGF
jgi:hypothetical protein